MGDKVAEKWRRPRTACSLVSMMERDCSKRCLACPSFHRAIRDRLPNGTSTELSAVLSSSERFIWTYTELPEEARPPWWGADLCRKIAAAGQLSALQWARANNCDWDYRTCEAAAGGGHLEVLQWLRANGCDWNHFTRNHGAWTPRTCSA